MRIDSAFTLSGMKTEEAKPTEGNSNNIEIKKDNRLNEEISDYPSFPKTDENLLNKAIEKANKTLEDHNRIIKRQVHEVTKAVIFKIEDKDTGEVIKEFPPEKIQDMIAKMWELAGLFVDERS